LEPWTFFGRDSIIPQPFLTALGSRTDSSQRWLPLVLEPDPVGPGGFGLLAPRSNIGLLFVGGSCRVFLVSSCFELVWKKNMTRIIFRKCLETHKFFT
jgi:hypothetical protein